MPVTVKPGTRLRSATCTTEVVVVKGLGDLDLRCGGRPLVPAGGDGGATGPPGPPHDAGTQLGKRYALEDGSVELLCSKAGAGSLSLGDVPLPVRSAKSLPSSD